MCIESVATWVGLIASIATVVGLGVAIWQYLAIIYKQKRAYLNAIFDEIKINLDIRRGTFFPIELANDYSKLSAQLINRRKDSAFFGYDNPTDSSATEAMLYQMLNFTLNPKADGLPYANEYLPISNYAIKTALGSGLAHRLLPDRIVLNLGHLSYAIDRDTFRLKNFNDNVLKPMAIPAAGTPVPTMGFRTDYIDWVHFRSYFLLIDMVMTFGRKNFVDKTEYDRIKAFCE
jgi:hypothetical protein